MVGEEFLGCVRYYRSYNDIDILDGRSVFQCNFPHQWIALQQVFTVSVYCDWVGCHVLCLRHAIPVWQHNSQRTTATRRHCRDMTSDVKATLNPNNQTNKIIQLSLLGHPP